MDNLLRDPHWEVGHGEVGRREINLILMSLLWCQVLVRRDADAALRPGGNRHASRLFGAFVVYGVY